MRFCDLTVSYNFSCIVLYVEVNCQCSPIGTNNETEFIPVKNHSFYLNTARPAPCSGTIQRWRYCYYRPDTNADRFRVTVAVYRRMGSGNDTHYRKVESSQRVIQRRDDQIPSADNFWCRNLNNNNNRQFDIEIGDIVAACIYEPTQTNRKQLDIVSEAIDHSLMQTSNENQCGDNMMPSSISGSQLSIVDSRLLHLSAIITSKLYTDSTMSYYVILSSCCI